MRTVHRKRRRILKMITIIIMSNKFKFSAARTLMTAHEIHVYPCISLNQMAQANQLKDLLNQRAYAN
ncbi:unnamed protein product [Anisakis simplex]|uniref:Uncharacterized protein n=1 Tax=Anisakis simplex TaxID=6269 RepID=A0A0M3K451_ANISI|nr:unnamed protein product [Anisakis simplex]